MKYLSHPNDGLHLVHADPPPGETAVLLNDIFVLEPDTWTGYDPMGVSGTPPGPRQGHGFSSLGDTLYVHGGGGVCNSGNVI